MAKTTITEALAEVKTLNDRIQKKRQACLTYFIRDNRMRDPMEKEGGTAEFVRKERQAIGDLEKRIVAIRVAIQAANQATNVTVGDRTMTVAEWLTWRKEVAPGANGFLGAMSQGLARARQESLRTGQRVTDAEKATDLKDLVVAVSESNLAKEIEEMAQVLGDLDGKLSLLNATTTIEV